MYSDQHFLQKYTGNYFRHQAKALSWKTFVAMDLNAFLKDEGMLCCRVNVCLPLSVGLDRNNELEMRMRLQELLNSSQKFWDT